MAIIKIAVSDDQTMANLSQYINTEKAVLIISGIFLSVIVAFSIGALVQYVSRLFLTFNFEQKPKIYGALFAGIALSAITYFIFMKGLKGTSYYSNIKGNIEGNETYIIAAAFVIWTSVSYMLTKLFKVNIYKVIITVGTFALAFGFCG